MTLKDRCIMKFRTVALQPEYIKSLRQIKKEQEYVQKPVVDEQQLTKITQIL